MKPGAQVACATVIALAIAWGAASTGGYILESHKLQAQRQEVLQAQEDYLRLLGDVARYHHAQQSIMQSLQESQRTLLAQLSETQREQAATALSTLEVSDADAVLARSALQDRADRFEQDVAGLFRAEPELAALGDDIRASLGRDPAERDAVSAARDVLRDNLDNTRQRLASAEEENRRLRERLSERETALRQVREDLVALRDSRDDLEVRRQALTSWLNDARRSAGDWRGEARTLDERLIASERARAALEEQEADLNQQIESVTASLQEARQRGQTLEQTVAALETDLSDSRQRNANLQRERGSLVRQVDSLQLRLASMQDAQQSFVDRLSARAREGIEALEATVEHTGLDVDRLLNEVGEGVDPDARGGPLLPLLSGEDLGDGARSEADQAAVDALEQSVLRLDEEVTRLNSLQLALTALPLAEPLDEYWISSTFGGRRDPITGAAARHEGLDFAAAMGSPVYAAGPGTIVHADWNGAYGRMVEVDHGFGVRSRYAHLRSISVAIGDQVGHRELIGQLGTSGRSTGPHVHYEILVNGTPYDPMKFVKAGEDVFKE